MMRDNRTILFVDDDPDMLEIGGIVIRQAGYSFISAASGKEGLAHLVKEKPGLVILDYFMPGMNGYEFMEQVSANPEYRPVRDIPVIMLTAASEDDVERQKLFELGLSAFLLKPFGNRELLNVIDNVFILTDLRRKNQELREQVRRSEYKYQDLIENASDLIFTLDMDGTFIFINRRLSSISGLDRDDWVGKKLVDLVHPEDRAIAAENFERTISGKARIFEVRLQSGRTKSVYLAININPIFERGHIIGCVAIARNITEKKQLEHEIIELKNFNESIIESMGSGLITIDLNNKVTSFNNSAAEILGYAPDEVLHKTLDEVFTPDDCERLLMNIHDPDQGLLNREMKLTGKGGDAIFIGFTVTPRYDTNDRRVGTIISFKDITQIKQMQAEVQRMDRLASMGVLASGIAHEIRNPLAGIKTIAQTLEEEIEPDDSRREYVSRIVRQVNRMDDLLRTIFSYAKPRQPRRKFLRFQEITQEVVALLENRIRRQSVTYEELFHHDLPLVYVDFYQIQQVFVNLFLNALDAMPEGGTLRLEATPEVTTINRVDRRGGSFPYEKKSAVYAQVLLSDSGTGIDDETLPAIFNPFFTTKPQGAGLGLSIVYRIIMEHQGDIQVESKIQKGTTFKVLLPTEE